MCSFKQKRCMDKIFSHSCILICDHIIVAIIFAVNVLGVIVVSPQIFIFFSMLCMHHPDTGNVFLRLFSSYRILPADPLRIRKYLPWYVPCLSFVLFSLL